jgi:hypothetical protein
MATSIPRYVEFGGFFIDLSKYPNSEYSQKQGGTRK